MSREWTRARWHPWWVPFGWLHAPRQPEGASHGVGPPKAGDAENESADVLLYERAAGRGRALAAVERRYLIAPLCAALVRLSAEVAFADELRSTGQQSSSNEPDGRRPRFVERFEEAYYRRWHERA